MQIKNALNWKIFVFLLCDINQQYQRVLDTRSNTNYDMIGIHRHIQLAEIYVRAVVYRN